MRSDEPRNEMAAYGVIGPAFPYPVGHNRVGGLRGDDWVLCVPVDRYTCEGLYLLDTGAGKALYACESGGGISNPGVHIWTHAAKDSFFLTRDQFSSMLIAQVAAKMIMVCPRLLGDPERPLEIAGERKKIAA